MKKIRIVLWTIVLLLMVFSLGACQQTSSKEKPKDYLIEDLCLRRGQSVTFVDLEIPEGVTLSLKDSSQTGIITISKDKISAIRTGSVEVEASSGDYKTDFTVYVVGSTNMYDPSLVMCRGETVDLNSLFITCFIWVESSFRR